MKTAQLHRLLKTLVPIMLAAACLTISPNATSTERLIVIPDSVSKSLSRGQAQDVIIQLDDAPIQAEAAHLRSASRPDVDSPEGVILKAKRYGELKRGITATLDMTDMAVGKEYSHLPMMALKVRSMAALNRLVARQEIVAIHENKPHHHMLTQSLPLIGQPGVASAGKTGAGTTVAVLDTGTDYTLAAFGSCLAPGGGCKVIYAADFAPSDGMLDDDGHGTNVAGIVLGVAPDTKIAALDVFDGASGWSTDIIDAINWSIANRATYNIVAMNLSLGGGGPYSTQCTSDVFAAPLASARSAGIVPVIASGNEKFTTGLSSPACVPAAVSVGAVYDSNMGSIGWSSCTDATTFADKVTCFSNSASYLTMLAPGALINAAGITMGGTSQAAPHVAGASAVLKAAFPADTPDQTVSRMTGSGVPVLDARNGLTKPRLDLLAAVVPDTTPNAFTFTDQTGVALNTLITSNSITVSGINTATSISIAGCTSTQCEYNINNSATWLTGAGTVSNNNTVKVRQKSSTAQSSMTSLILNIGGVTDSFDVTSGAPGTLAFSAPTYSVAEGTASVSLSVNRSGGSMGAASVSYATSNGSATAGSDYTAKSGTLSWLAGDASAKTISVSITNDTLVESAETFNVTLTNPVGATLGAQSSAVATITDTDNTLQFGSTTASVNEGAGTVTLNVTRTGSIGAAASVKYATAIGTATTADFTSTSGTLSWGAGDGSTKTITVPVTNDLLVENLETFSVTLSTPTGAALGTTTKSTVTIVDNDSTVQFSPSTSTVNESAGTVSFNAVRTAGTGAVVGAASVDYTSTNGTAQAGADYTASTGTLAWGAGALGVQTVTVPITNDTLVEASETFTVVLSNAVGASLGTAKIATATITDNDSNLQFGNANYSVSETGPVVTFSVTRTGSLTSAASVQYATADGSAVAGSDYTAASGTLSWAAGNGAAKTITVPITNDVLVEGAETFTATLANPSGATLGAITTATVTINDNDSQVQFSATDVIVSETAGNAVVTVNRIGNASQAVTVGYATVNGTASAGSDYTAKNGTLRWAANDAAPKTITIPVTNDLVTEGEEDFGIVLANPVNASLGNPVTVSVTLVDNEAAPLGGIAFSQAKYTVAEDGGSAVLTVTRNGDISAPATVNYSITPGSATTSDFTTRSGTLSWAAGDSAAKIITIPITNDTAIEQVEAFTVMLSNAVGTLLGAPAQATVAIMDDDDLFPRRGVMPAGINKPAAANAGWHVTADQSKTAIYSLGADVVGDSEVAQMEIAANFLAGNVSFALRTSSEASFDVLVFYIDGVEKGRWSGIQTAWTTVSYPLVAGVHTLTWSYEKDGTGSNGADTAWIDTLALPAQMP